MSQPSHAAHNWFDQGGQAYARFRPEYPPELAAYLASISPGQALAVDVGCGSGQLTCQLGEHFDTVLGLDPSADQLAHARPQQHVRYACAAAESLPLAAHGASLICAAQAAHWFDLPRFYAEVRRIAAPQAVLALISYGVLQLEGALDERFRHFYYEEIGPYWPAERALVDSGYATLYFPFEELAGPCLAIRLEWNLAEFLGYLSTWSAVRRARESGQEQLLQRFAADIAACWGEPNSRQALSWPLNLRIGRL